MFISSYLDGMAVLLAKTRQAKAEAAHGEEDWEDP